MGRREARPITATSPSINRAAATVDFSLMDYSGGIMKSHAMLPLALVLAVTLSATACSRDADDMPAAEPMPAESMPVEPATPPPMPEATDTPVDSGMTFAEMDANGDGGITQDELSITEMLHQHFSVADTDGDGKLSTAEVDAHRAAMASAPAN